MWQRESVPAWLGEESPASTFSSRRRSPSGRRVLVWMITTPFAAIGRSKKNIPNRRSPRCVVGNRLTPHRGRLRPVCAEFVPTRRPGVRKRPRNAFRGFVTKALSQTGVRQRSRSGRAGRMNEIGYRNLHLPSSIIQRAVWLYARFNPSLREVAGFMAEPGVEVSYETVRRRAKRSGPPIARGL